MCNVHQTQAKRHEDTHGLYRGYCKSEYMDKFPDDPLTLQMLYKDKGTATVKFIDSRFDGFQGTGDREIQINGILLHICLNRPLIPLVIPSQKYISITFNTDKYECSKTGKMVNPMLYRRLPLLEEEINIQIERIVKGVQVEGIRAPFIEIDYHL